MDTVTQKHTSLIDDCLTQSTDNLTESLITRNYLDFNTAAPQADLLHQEIDINDLKHNALSRLPDILQYLFPQGKRNKHQFTIGNLEGKPGKSLVVELEGNKAGFWKDFASDEGGDILALWAGANGLAQNDKSFPKVARSLAEHLNATPTVSAASQAKHNPQPKKLPMDNLGKHTGKWDYCNADGQLIVCMYRYDTDKGKVFRPWDPKAAKHKVPNPRPLYNQPGMKKDDHVVLVEGEKCAQALIDAGITATTAMNGANAPVDKTNWLPLKSKHVLIWPDNDDAGRNYADAVSHYLTEKGIAASIARLEVPDDKPEKWDVADAIDEKIDINDFIRTYAIEDKAQDNYQEIIPCHWHGEPPQREWLIKDWLPRGYVTALYGDGGIGKSLLAQQLMTCLATGKPWLGLETRSLRVYGVLCEDDENELWRRQYSINKSLKLTMTDLASIRFVSRIGFNNLLMTFDGKDSGQLTQFFDTLLQHVADFAPDLVVLDTAADLFGGNENNRTQVRQFVQNACAQIARRINGAVLLCAHPSDNGIQRKTGTGGSTAWNNTVRSRWYLTRPTEEDAEPNERVLSRKKSNYAANGSDLHLLWDEGAFREFTSDPKPKRQIGKKLASQHEKERKRKHDIILQLIHEQARMGHLYTMNQFCEAFENHNKLSLGSKDSIRSRLEVLATHGYLKFVKNADNYGLSNPARSKYGYLCVENMYFGTGEGKVNPTTGEISPQLLAIYPSHYKCRETGTVLGVENPLVWVHEEEAEHESPSL